MLFPARMLFVTIGVHRTHAGSLIESLHEAGLLEIRSVHEGPGENAAALVPGERGARIAYLAELRVRIERILSTFERMKPDERSLLGELLSLDESTPHPVPEAPPERLRECLEPLLEKGGHALEIWQRIVALEEQVEHLEREKRAAELLMPFGIEIPHLGISAYLCTIAGTLPASEAPAVLDALSKMGEQEVLVSWSRRGDLVTLLIAAEISLREELDRLLRTAAWEPVQLPPREDSIGEIIARDAGEIERLRGEISALGQEMERLRQEIARPLHAYLEELEIRMREEEALSLTGTTQEMVVIEGYIRERDRTALESLVDRASSGCAFCRFQESESVMRDVPTAYQHPSWLRPFQMLTTMFAVPRYNEIDPTLIIAPLIVAYFGIMLGDAGYGMILAILAFVLLYRFGRGNSMLRDLCCILLLCGISGVIFGLLQGGFFGDLLPRFFSVNVPFMLIDPLAYPVAILTIALAIGAIQLNFGLVLGVFQHLKEGCVKEAITEKAVWFILQPAAVVLVLGFLGWVEQSPAMQMAAGFGLLLGLGLLLYGHGPLGFFKVTNFLGDWLSYTRILALDLATLGIAMTINILAEMIASLHPFAVIFGLLFAIFGHIFNLVLQTLGGMIHALRLQYVEFFGKFYSGGGRAFSPFHSSRRYSCRPEVVPHD